MDNATSLSAARIGVGVFGWAFPSLGLRLFFLDGSAPQAPYLTRLFAVRDIALGAATLLAQGEARKNMIKIGIVVDSADAAAGVLAGMSGGVTKPRAVLLTAAGLAAAGTGAAALTES